MKPFFLSLFLFYFLSSYSQPEIHFDYYKPEILEILTTKPIVVKLLNENNPNSVIWNSNIKKYAESIFGADRIFKYLDEKEFKKFVTKRKYRDQYLCLSLYYDSSTQIRETIIYLKSCGYSITYKSPGPLEILKAEKNNTYFVLTEADLKMTLTLIKERLDYLLIDNKEVFAKAKEDLLKQYKTSSKVLNPSASELKDLTLLIDRKVSGFDDKIENLISNYKYKIQLVDKSRIDEAILNNEKGYAFLLNNYKSIYKTEDLHKIYNYLYQPKSGNGVHLYPFHKDFSIDIEQYLITLHNAID